MKVFNRKNKEEFEIYSSAEVKALRKQEVTNSDLYMLCEISCAIYEIKFDDKLSSSTGQDVFCTTLILRAGSGFFIWKLVGMDEQIVKNLKINDCLVMKAKVNAKYMSGKGMNQKGSYIYIEQVFEYQITGQLRELDQKKFLDNKEKENQMSDKIISSVEKSKTIEKPKPKRFGIV